MITVRSVVAHTECGPFDERGEVELPLDSVSEHKIPWRTLRSATVTEISAQLPESIRFSSIPHCWPGGRCPYGCNWAD